ncbi:MAG: GGDEF domain-containing protein, partial [Blastopirellula sp. JB062]
LDIDFFKKINDQHGHLVGDAVLKSIAKTLVHTTRDSDYVTRYGGEEFAILLPETDCERAKDAAQRIIKAIRDQPFRDQKLEIPLTISVGVAQVVDLQGPEALIAKADEALYAAKAEGRDRGCYFDGEQILSTLSERSEPPQPAREFHDVCADLRTRLMDATQ